MLLNKVLLTDILKEAVDLHPAKQALVCGSHQVSYSQLNDSVNSLANFFQENGVKRGCHVITQLDNSYEAIIAFWAALKVGAGISIIDPELSLDKTCYILQDSNAKCFLSSKLFIKYFDKSKFPNLSCLISVSKQPVIPDCYLTLSEILTEYSSCFIPKSIALDLDIAAIIYTSGSTGEPKGVVLTHKNILAALLSINQYLGNTSSEIIISALPLAFDYGLYQMLLAFSVGGCLILEKNLLWPGQLLKNTAKFKATALPGVPTTFSLLYEHFKLNPIDLSSIRYVTNTGAALNPVHIQKIRTMFPYAAIFSMYGLTECKRCSYLPPEDIDKKPLSVGIPIPNTEFWIVDEDDNKMEPNKIGQLVVRGSHVMQGYLNKPEETAAKLKPGILPGEKVLYTGDYCSIDDDGYLYYHGRMDETLKCAGIKVSPKEIEDVIYNFPGVKEAAVLGIPDEVSGTVIHAYISIESEKISKENLFEYCKNKLESKKIPKEFFVLSSLPKTHNGKIDKQALALFKRQICV